MLISTSCDNLKTYLSMSESCTCKWFNSELNPWHPASHSCSRYESHTSAQCDLESMILLAAWVCQSLWVKLTSIMLKQWLSLGNWPASSLRLPARLWCVGFLSNVFMTWCVKQQSLAILTPVLKFSQSMQDLIPMTGWTHADQQILLSEIEANPNHTAHPQISRTYQ